MAQKIRWGVISTARIGKKTVVPAIQKAHNCEVVAVASRSLDKAQEYANDLGIAKAYGSYEEMLDSGEIDAVYNPLPNDGHAKWSMAAAERGIAVLCEKPLALDAAEAQEMADFFEARGVLLAEAFMWRFHPQHNMVRQMIAEGVIGTPKVMNASFTFSIGNEADIRLNPAMGGGSLMDVGCYCINAMRVILGEEPDGGKAFGIFGKTSEVDEMLTGVLSFPSGVLGHFDCGFRASRTNLYDIRGTEGRIRIEPAFIPQPDETAVIRVWRGSNDSTYEEIAVPPANQYTLMAEDFADALLNKRPFRYPIEDAIRNMIVIDNLLSSAKGEDGYWF